MPTILNLPTLPPNALFFIGRVRLGRNHYCFELFRSTQLISNYPTKEIASNAAWRILGAEDRDTGREARYSFPAYLEGFASC